MTGDWRAANRANWDERVGLHLQAPSYNLGPLRAGQAALHPIEEAELGPVDGLRVCHLQCHFGRDTLALAQRGAMVTGVDFSGEAVRAARVLAQELGLGDRASFVEADLYDAVTATGGAGAFDRVFTTWGTIGWLPDIRGWAQVVADLLAPGGRLYFADGHPSALVFDDAAPGDGTKPGWFLSYFSKEVFAFDSSEDYASDVPLRNTRTYEWMHGLGEIVSALIDAGLQIDFVHEHAEIPWKMFACLEPAPGGMYRWPDTAWLPLAVSISAHKA